MSYRNILLLALTVGLGLVAQSGCRPAGGSQTKITNRSADASSQWSEDLFSFALENLNHLEDNDCDEMLRSTQQRLAILQQPRAAPGMLPPNALLASWPEPDMLRQVVSRLNQWVDTQEKPAESKPDPMLATLPADLLKLPMVENLGQAHFTAYDGYMLMEAVWLRDASRSKWAGGGTADELQVARSLFDWTIRNIQTDYDSPGRVPQVPWETLFLGHGTAMERAWTYILLLRQRGIDAVLLALPDDSAPATLPGKSPATPPGKKSLKPWCVGVLIGEKEKKLYLFDPKLCLPIPAPDGIRADKSGRLDVQPATLDQVVADPKLLDRLAADVPVLGPQGRLEAGRSAGGGLAAVSFAARQADRVAIDGRAEVGAQCRAVAASGPFQSGGRERRAACGSCPTRRSSAASPWSRGPSSRVFGSTCRS